MKKESQNKQQPILNDRLVSDITFATRLLSFVKDIQVNDPCSADERDYIERVARHLLTHQAETAVDKDELDYLKRIHPEGSFNLKAELEEQNKNIIPEMTHPLGKGWSQPDRSEITIDHQYARMNKSTFDRIYHVRGSGALRMVYEGKMWKVSDDNIHWRLHWWSASDDPDKCKGNVREIIINQ